MTKDELEILSTAARQLIKDTADFILKEVGLVKEKDVDTKALNSLVSYVDKEAEKKLVAGFQKLLPESTFLTEEETVEQSQGKYQWIIDPLDGTTNFLHQLPCFAISVALRENGQTILGVVYEINQKECFHAVKGGGAFLNDKKIEVSKTKTLSESLLATGFPYYDFSGVDSYLEVLKYFIENTRGIRRYGAAAVDLAYVACGRFDGFFEYSLSPWDVAAGAFLIQEAGGKVSDFIGDDNYLFGKEVVAGNGNVHEKILQEVRNAFYQSSVD